MGNRLKYRGTRKNRNILITKYIHIQSTTVYVPSSELGLSHPFSRLGVGPSWPLPPEPEPKGGGAHSPAGEGLGESKFRRLEKKLSPLPTLRSLSSFLDLAGRENQTTTQCRSYTEEEEGPLMLYNYVQVAQIV
jgi:hypothetical protein